MTYGKLINSNDKVIILFYSDWHQDCMFAQQVLAQISSQLGETCKAVKIDTDKNDELCSALRIKGLPTFLVYKEGQMAFRHSGEISKEQFLIQLQ